MPALRFKEKKKRSFIESELKHLAKNPFHTMSIKTLKKRSQYFMQQKMKSKKRKKRKDGLDSQIICLKYP